MSTDSKGESQDDGAEESPSGDSAKVDPREAAEALAQFEADEAKPDEAAASSAKAAPPDKPAAATTSEPPPIRGRTERVRGDSSVPTRILFGAFCLALTGLAWWWVTRGEAEQRIVTPGILPSPAEVFGSFKSLWFDRALTRNAASSLWRVLQGYGFALLLGVPLGVAAGCFPRIHSFMAPLTVFGRNVPIAALVPLTIMWFGTDETQKVMFIFIACVAFVIFDATQNIRAVDQKYVDTAYTLGASRSQIIFKVLIPLALPDIFNSMRLLFGLAFGYIILAEIVNLESGLGALIAISQRRGPKEHVFLCLIVIALLAYLIDRLLYFTGRQLFPYRYRS